MRFFIVASIILLNSYIGKLPQREFHDFSYRKRQVLLGSHDYDMDVLILTRAQFVPKRFVCRVADHLALKYTKNICRRAAYEIHICYSVSYTDFRTEMFSDKAIYKCLQAHNNVKEHGLY